MKLKTKKLLAREFLVLVICILIAFIAFLGTYAYNSFKDSDINFLHVQSDTLRKDIENIESQYISKIESQRKFHDLSKENRWHTVDWDYSQLWNRLDMLEKQDSIKFKWNSWDSEFKNELKRYAGFSNEVDFSQFITENSLTQNEIKSKIKVDSMRFELNELQRQITNNNQQKMNFDEKINLALLFLTAVLTVAFLLRYIFYSIRWSVRTLKKEA